jgi:hypothetical protein
LLEVDTMTQLISDFLGRLSKKFKVGAPLPAEDTQWTL